MIDDKIIKSKKVLLNNYLKMSAHMNITHTTQPKLLKSRIKHTRLLVLFLVPFILLNQQTKNTNYEIAQMLGYFLIIVCVLGRSYSTLFIGGRKNNEVICVGPYSIVRNPLYVFSFLGVVGIGLQTSTITFALLLPLIFLLYYPFVVLREESFLLHKFGQSYRDYMHQVPRWIPKPSLWREPEHVDTSPAFVRRTMLDASIFFLALPAFKAFEYVSVSGWLPFSVMLP